jgi:hypothetical protein
MRLTDLLSRLEGVTPRREGKYIARCPAHEDRTPSLSVQDGYKAILVRCWSGCGLLAITTRLGIGVKDLFHNALPDPRQRQIAVQRRRKVQAEQQAEQHARGRRNDVLRQAECLIQSTRGIRIDDWPHDELNRRLNALADAYDTLAKEPR